MIGLEEFRELLVATIEDRLSSTDIDTEPDVSVMKSAAFLKVLKDIADDEGETLGRLEDFSESLVWTIADRLLSTDLDAESDAGIMKSAAFLKMLKDIANDGGETIEQLEEFRELLIANIEDRLSSTNLDTESDAGVMKSAVFLKMLGNQEWKSSGFIGQAGHKGFGVGTYPYDLPSGFMEMEGTTDRSSENYGNYQFEDGSILVFVPRFYYRIGSPDSPLYATYGLNAVDIKGANAFPDVASANAAGYALHRAFIDASEVKSGFFIDKYRASADGTGSCKSVRNGVPLSLTASAGWTRTYGMVTDEGTCNGSYRDAILLSRARANGRFNCSSVFMVSALGMLALAHAQASTSDTYCAWYDPNGATSFPKGNNRSLDDYSDRSVVYTTAGDSPDAKKALTGSATNFARTTHNGQACGVADHNGLMWEVLLGATNPGTSISSIATIASGDLYVLKESWALASLTHDFDTETSAWGTTDNLLEKYDLVEGLFWWNGSTQTSTRYGYGANQVFSGATEGLDYLRTAIGVPQSNAVSTAGTALFGKNELVRRNVQNMFILGCGSMTGQTSAGIHYRAFNNTANITNIGTVGFRAGAYCS
jgi:hypothetical protein